MGIRDKLDSFMNPNALLKRTIWSSPQLADNWERGEGKLKKCGVCRYWEIDSSWGAGQCKNIRVFAAYGRPAQMPAHYCCSYFERKEKEDGK